MIWAISRQCLFQIDEKYNIPATNIKNIYKQSKKGYVQLLEDLHK